MVQMSFMDKHRTRLKVRVLTAPPAVLAAGAAAALPGTPHANQRAALLATFCFCCLALQIAFHNLCNSSSCCCCGMHKTSNGVVNHMSATRHTCCYIPWLRLPSSPTAPCCVQHTPQDPVLRAAAKISAERRCSHPGCAPQHAGNPNKCLDAPGTGRAVASRAAWALAAQH
jgi:hypothetical protein